MNKKDHKRDAHITFHNMGVSGHGQRFGQAKKKGWKMMTIGEIIEYLGHSNVSIDKHISGTILYRFPSWRNKNFLWTFISKIQAGCSFG